MLARDRFVGCLVGLTIGDALGAPYEFERVMDPDTEIRFGVGVFGTAPGEGTDDSALAFAVAESCAALGHFEPEDYAQRLVAWVATGPPDVGAQTRKAARAWASGRGPEPDETAQGNGAVMACAGIGLLHAGDPAAASRAAEQLSRTTHPSSGSVLACQQVCAAVAAMADPARPTGRGLWRPYLAPVPAGSRADGASMGWAPGTAGLAFAALELTDPTDDAGSPTVPVDGDEALRWLIRHGGDTDTNAAVAGALIGACHGPDVFGRLVEQALGAPIAARLAQKLAGLHTEHIGA